jgi:hypothetical protein
LTGPGGAAIGVLLTFEKPTRPMRKEVASAGQFNTEHWGNFPRIHLLTVSDLLDGKAIDYPKVTGINCTLKRAPRAKSKVEKPHDLFANE